MPRHTGGILDGLPDWTAYVEEVNDASDADEVARLKKRLERFVDRFLREFEGEGGR